MGEGICDGSRQGKMLLQRMIGLAGVCRKDLYQRSHLARLCQTGKEVSPKKQIKTLFLLRIVGKLGEPLPDLLSSLALNIFFQIAQIVVREGERMGLCPSAQRMNETRGYLIPKSGGVGRKVDAVSGGGDLIGSAQEAIFLTGGWATKGDDLKGTGELRMAGVGLRPEDQSLSGRIVEEGKRF